MDKTTWRYGISKKLLQKYYIHMCVFNYISVEYIGSHLVRNEGKRTWTGTAMVLVLDGNSDHVPHV